MRIIRPSTLTWVSAGVAAAAVLGTAAYLLGQYDGLPDLLAVHFTRTQRANGWQYRTYPRVLTPVFIQAALALVSGVVAALLLSRSHEPDDGAADVRAALVAAEVVVLFATIWIAFQAYAAMALVSMWHRGHGGLGAGYGVAEGAGVLLTIGVVLWANVRIGSPAPRPFVAAHWRLRHLYHNPADPALFVPTRDGGRWTLNFGRPVAAVLMAITLGLGMVLPTIILRLMLR